MTMLENWISAVLDASVRACVLGGIAGLGLLAGRVRGAAARHAVWTAVTVSMVLLPVATALVPALELRILPVPAAIADLADPGPARFTPVPATPSAVNGVPARVDWAGWLALGYLAVAVMLAAQLAVGAIRIRRVVRAARVVDDLRVPGQRAYESDRVSVPVTCGWLRPRILLPAGWRSWDAWKLRVVLVHEVAHIRRADALVASLAALNRCMYWFHPLAWWLERRLAALAEEACDDSAVAVTGDRARYAGVLLEVAASLGNRPRLIAGQAMARSSRVHRRIDLILDAGRRVAEPVSARGWAAIAACAVALISGVSAIRLLAQAPAPQPLVLGPRTPQSLPGQLTPEYAARLEERLRQSPDDLEARATLLNYYFMNAQQARRVPHILWLIEHHPDAMVLLMAPGKITPFRAPFDDQVAYERAKRLWFEQAERHAGNAQVLMNAAMALEDSDPERAEQWLLQARQIQPAEQQGALLLAQLYVRYISAALPYANTAFAAHARDQLERTNDSALAGLAGGSLMQTEPELGGRLLQRARSLDPENYRWTKQVEEFEKIRREAQPAADRPTQPVKVRVSEAVQAAKLREQVSPIYPALARQARIQGDVVMNLTVAADGKVSNIELVSGHPLLIPAAQEAVRQWIYEPTYLNGSAIEVRVTVRVPFRL